MCMQAASAFGDPVSLPWELGPILTFYPDLLQLCHLSDGLLQVFHGSNLEPSDTPPVSSHSREARAARCREGWRFGKLPSSRPRGRGGLTLVLEEVKAHA